MARALRLVQQEARRFEPPSRGPLLTPRKVQEKLAAGGFKVSREWLKQTLPHRVTLSERVYGWYEHDVNAWMESRRAS